MRKAAVVITFSLPDHVAEEKGLSALAMIVRRIDPPSLPYFDGDVRLSADPGDADELVAWLDERTHE